MRAQHCAVHIKGVAMSEAWVFWLMIAGVVAFVLAIVIPAWKQ